MVTRVSIPAGLFISWFKPREPKTEKGQRRGGLGARFAGEMTSSYWLMMCFPN